MAVIVEEIYEDDEDFETELENANDESGEPLHPDVIDERRRNRKIYGE